MSADVTNSDLEDIVSEVR